MKCGRAQRGRRTLSVPQSRDRRQSCCPKPFGSSAGLPKNARFLGKGSTSLPAAPGAASVRVGGRETQKTKQSITGTSGAAKPLILDGRKSKKR